jgi:hypothetical protein
MKDFLLRFTHEVWRQGPERVTEMRLVRAHHISGAKLLLQARSGLRKIRDIENLTLDIKDG